MTDYNLSEFDEEQAKELLLARAKAIQAYAFLEMSLAHLFSQLLGGDPRAAGLVFYKISNARTRNGLVESLIKLQHENEYNLYTNSLFLRIQQLDLTRNKIVHWHQWMSVDAQDSETKDARCLLKPPNFWSNSDETIDADQMDEFKTECKFFSHQLGLFTVHLGPVPLDAPWPDIFHQPITYPPPDDYPVPLKHKEPPTPPQSSGA